ncbi:MAG: glycosyltransferase family 4 protein [Candidatus Omnitrophica bacterium]|nr:glycosyltransferase family 4 protein [Candidatus Omnitrophota bacterium]
MKICFLCTEIFAWGKYGGFGRATRTIGRELVQRGIDVYAIVPRRVGQNEYEELDGIKVSGFKPYDLLAVIKYAKTIDADIYHSEEPSLISVLAHIARPRKKHIVTFRDPRDSEDWYIEYKDHSLSKVQVLLNRIFENNFIIDRSLQKFDGLYCAAECLCEKSMRVYKLKEAPVFLPTPVLLPNMIKKANTPTVCYLARLDRRKRPELFLQLAEKFPHVRFLLAGTSRDKKWERYLVGKYRYLKNLEILGFIDQFNSDKVSELLSQSWILVNTAVREGLPNAFIEALAHKCALLSYVDPNEYASKYGYRAVGDDFDAGLRYLLENDRWRGLGDEGQREIAKTFEMNTALNAHIDIYQKLLAE